jgi:hypothetical protein
VSTILEMKQDKHLLMHDIEVLLNEFQKKHCVEVSDIEICQAYTVGDIYQRVIVQDLEVKL